MTETWLRRLSALTLLALTGLVVVLTLSGASGPERPLLTLAFFCLVPGNAIVGLAAIGPPSMAFSLGLGLSLALSTLVAQVMVWCGAWNPTAGLLALAVVAVPALGVQVLRGERSRVAL